MRASTEIMAGGARDADVASRSVDRSLLLIRHPPTHPDPNLAPQEWGLGRDGLRAVMAMGDLLPPGTRRIVCAPRSATRETARVLGAVRALGDAVVVDERLDEVATPIFGDEDDPAQVESYLVGGELPGWEAPDVALRRFSDALHFARRPEIGARVVVTHGIVMAMWLAPRVGVDPFALWSGLRSPDAWAYNPSANAVTRLVRWRAASGLSGT